MQVSVESTSTLERSLTVQIPNETIDSEVDSRLKKLKTKVKLDGFRAGKVPQSLINKRYKGSVQQEVLGDVINKGLHDAIEQESLHPASQPYISDIKYEPGVPVEFKATFEVYPEIAIQSFSEIKIERPQAEVGDEDLDSAIDRLRKQSATWKAVERPAANGDQVKITFEGVIDGEKVDSACGENVPLELGSNTFIPGFEEELVGCKQGDKKELNLTFPDDYGNAEFAGKPAVFTVTIDEVNEAELPEFDEKFFEQFNLEDKTIEGLKTFIKGLMEKELQRAVDNKLKSQLFDQIIALHDIEVPKALVDAEKQRVIEGIESRGGSKDGLDNEVVEKQAADNVKLALVCSEIIKSEQIKAEPQKVREHIEEKAKDFPDPSIFINFYYSNKDRLKEIEAGVLEEQLIERILQDATITDKNYAYNELVYY